MDPVSSARSARESLARGLAALQSPGLPLEVVSVADPVAQAMSALHRIEATRGADIAEAAPAALTFARHALAMLQSQTFQHPAVDQAMAAIAGSLGTVHQLSQLAAPPVAAPAPAVSPYAGTLLMDAPGPPAAHAPPAHVPPPAHGSSPHVPPAAPPHASHQEPAWQPTGAPPPPAWHPSVALAEALQQAAAPAAPPPVAARPAVAAPPAVAPPPAVNAAAHGSASRVEAALGAHSPTNFYKGLAGNDVVDAGGVFIATYQLLPIGTEFVVHVSLPGGYEFDSLAVVRWVREAPHSTRGEEAPPGFGAQFLQISAEARQLVYRYVRNREPLFYDDL